MITAADRLPAPVARLAGRWYGVLGEMIVSFALVEADGAELNALYTWATGGGRGGGVYAARVEAGGVRVTLPHQLTLTVVPVAADTITATIVPVAQPSNFSVFAPSTAPVRAELRAVVE